MNVKLISTTVAVLAFSIFSLAACATSDERAATEPSANKPMRPHSHVEEKTGMPVSSSPVDGAAAADTPSGNIKADQDKSKHFHPHDGK